MFLIPVANSVLWSMQTETYPAASGADFLGSRVHRLCLISLFENLLEIKPGVHPPGNPVKSLRQKPARPTRHGRSRFPSPNGTKSSRLSRWTRRPERTMRRRSSSTWAAARLLTNGLQLPEPNGISMGEPNAGGPTRLPVPVSAGSSLHIGGAGDPIASSCSGGMQRFDDRLLSQCPQCPL